MPSTFPDGAVLTHIAGQPVGELARQFGTPLYVYDAAPIVRRLGELRSFDVIRFAQKACSNIAIVDLVRRHGGLVDCVSAGEIHRALAAGFKAGQETQPPEIVYTADIFDRQSLEYVVRHDIHVNCGSPDMIDQYGERSADKSITIRVNPGFGHGHSQKTNTGGSQSKHGIWHEQLADCLARAARHRLTISGLHMHIGSGSDLAHLSQVCGALEKAAVTLGPSIRSISAGGGLPIDYREGRQLIDVKAYFEMWDATRRRLAERFGHAVSLEVEPGRYLVAESGYLISEVRAIKTAGENAFYLVDAGFNNLARPILYGAYHPMAICPASSTAGQNATSDQRDVIVGGPLCESGDIFTQLEGGFVTRRPLPAARVGDYLVIGIAGAYGYVMASNYNTRPLVAEVLIENGHVNLIRRAQTLDDIVRGEVIPSRS
jgi:diaminopimelate decarboxylase